MKKFAILSLVVCFGIALASSALALRWPDNASYRVSTMGNAALGIEDETTALTIFNHQNIAGVAFNKKENRSDFGLGYASTNYTVDYDSGAKYENLGTGFDLVRPGAEYRGITYWLNDNVIIRAGIEGLMLNMKEISTASDGTSTEEVLAFSGLGGGASATYKLDGGLAFGAGVTYIGAGGKPDSLDGAYNVFGTTSKFEIAASVLSWGVNAGYELMLENDNKLTFGLGVHSDDDLPDFVSSEGDYNVTQTMEGEIPTSPTTTIAMSIEEATTQSPLFISGEAIFNMGSMLEAGLLFDYGMKSINEKITTTTDGTAVETDYKTNDITELVIAPVVQANIPVGDGMAILPGVQFSTAGSSNTDDFSLDYTTTDDDNDTYKSSETVVANNLIGIGCGFQAMEKQLQVAVQYETGSWTSDYTPYAADGTAGTVIDSEGSVSNIKAGAEFWVIPMLALRAGYQLLASTTKDGTVDSDGNIVDDISNTNRITLGAGLSLPQGMLFDLLVELDTNTSDPVSDPEPSNTAMNILLGVKLPI
ncbi:OprO/OprP family phosphate-selective porin [bacterium]|nr:OprO/OprP family phosphate-selective porin [bacterium]